MILAVDIGGTKTLLASFTNEGHLTNTAKFDTAQNYNHFLEELAATIARLGEDEYQLSCVAIPGRVDAEHGRGVSFGNLGWRNVPIQADVEHIIKAPVIVENDAKVGGLSEALLIKKEFKRVLYVTIGTGIGFALITNGVIDDQLGSGGGHSFYVAYQGKTQRWEEFASGKAIVKQFGKRAEDIRSEADWKTIARRISVGLADLNAIFEPEVIIIGGGVGQFYQRFGHFLHGYLKKYETPLTPMPFIKAAQRPEEAVIYGCFELAKQRLQAIHYQKLGVRL